MKEEAPSRKLPPKSGGTASAAAVAANSTPTKLGNDEILNAMLRFNNFDSISRESLDIDLSACVTISSDTTAIMMSGNSLSSTDFWRMLDESAQNPQLDTTSCSDDGAISRDDHMPTIGAVKEEQPSSFSGTFLRPEPPTSMSLFSPLKKNYKPLPPAAETQRKLKIASNLSIFETKKARVSPSIIKTEPPEQLLADSNESDTNNSCSGATGNIIAGDNKTISTSSTTGSSFSLFKLPIPTNGPIVTLTPTSPTSLLARCSQTKPNDAKLGTKVKPITEYSDAFNAEIKTSGLTPPQPIYKCIECDGLELNGEQELSTHTTAGHRIMYKCSVCEREFEQEAGIKKHLKTHRSVETRKDVWKKCPDCGKCLKLGSMWMHRKIHSDNKKYGCDICGQKFVQKINLTHHSRVHTAEKPYECPECQKRFQERSHLQRHQKYHAQTRSYRCEKCGKMYKTERCLKVHNLVHLEQRPFACNVCDKSFISNSKLKQHSNIHTGERPFKCNYCPRDFTNFPNWLKHTRRRHKVDHKTGEHLENIPSYCSKKSTKTAKEKAPKANDAVASTTTSTTTTTTTTAAATATTSTTEQKSKSTNATAKASASGGTNATANPTVNTKSNPTNTVNAKPPVKRKKKVTPPELPASAINSNDLTKQPSKTIGLVITNVVGNATLPESNKSSSRTTKRERKQLTPKQVQKPPPPPTPTPTHQSQPQQQQQQQQQQQPQQLVIKKEPTEAKTVNTGIKPAVTLTPTSTSAFPDLHCLSITSAEELIMEQALEMEECGLYDAQVSTVDTDNAISSEAAAALHFKIKNEFPIEIVKEEDLICLKGGKNRALCSSLESSPFSSPASIEITSTTLGTTNTMPATSTVMTTPTYYLTTPFMNLQATGGTLVTTPSTPLVDSNVNINAVTTSTTNMPTANDVPSHVPHSAEQQSTELSQTQLPTSLPTTATAVTTAHLINQLYLPMAVRMPLLMPTNQVLPSVDTLLFSSSQNANTGGGGGGSFFQHHHHHHRGKNATSATTTAQHNHS